MTRREADFGVEESIVGGANAYSPNRIAVGTANGLSDAETGHRIAANLETSSGTGVDHWQEEHQTRICISNKPFMLAVNDTPLRTWSLQVAHSGESVLALNQCTVGMLSARDGSTMLRADGCPFERAADLLAAVSAAVAVEMSNASRSELEFALARWIPVYFEL